MHESTGLKAYNNSKNGLGGFYGNYTNEFIIKNINATVPVNVILPVDKMVFPGMPVKEIKEYKPYICYTEYLAIMQIG